MNEFQSSKIVVQYLNAERRWNDINDGTSAYYNEDGGKPFESIKEAQDWCLKYHDEKTYPGSFEPQFWRIVERMENYFPLLEVKP